MIKFPTLITIITLCISVTAPVKADVFDIASDNYFVPISVDFTGRTMRIYGATDIKGNIMLSVRSTEKTFSLYKKVKKYGFWVDSKIAIIKNTPAYYNLLTTHPINLKKFKDGGYELGSNNIEHKIIKLNPTVDTEDLWVKITDVQTRIGKYSYLPVGVIKKGHYLFEAIVKLPSDAPTGRYTLTAHIITDAGLKPMITKSFYVGRNGITKFMYVSARDYPLWYAIIVILLSLAIGILATYRPKHLRY